MVLATDSFENAQIEKVRNSIIESGPSLPVLGASSLNYVQKATADNTRKAYRQDIQQFERWGGRLPADTETIVRYLHDQATKLNPRTLKRRITALKQFHVYQGFPDPTEHSLVLKTLKGIQNTHGKPKQQAPALRLDQLQQAVEYLRSDLTLKNQRNLCLLTLGFFGALRSSELLAVRVEDLDWRPEGLHLKISKSKTDQEGEGQWCALPKTDNDLCPLKHAQNWLEASGIEEGYLFRSINRWQKIGDKTLSTVGLNKILKTLAEKCGWADANLYSSHSLRRGLATSTSLKGASIKAIMRQGRWRHEGTVLQYIEEGQAFEDNAVNVLFD